MAGIFRVVGVVGDTVITGANITATVIESSGKILENMVEAGKNYSSALIDYSSRFADEAKCYRDSFDKDRYMKRLKIEQGLEDSVEFKKLTAKVLNCDEEEVTIDKIEATIQEYYDFLDKVKI